MKLLRLITVGLGLAAAIAIQAQSIPAADVADALDAFKLQAGAKIDQDLETNARAFADAKNISRAAFWSDLFSPVLDIARAVYDGLTAIPTKSPNSVRSWVKTSLQSADTATKVLSLANTGLDRFRQDGQNLQLAIDGPAYTASVNAMLDRADETWFLFFDYDGYRLSIRNDLNGIAGSSPIRVARKSASVDRTGGQVLPSVFTAKTHIYDQLRLLSTEMRQRQLPSARIAEIAAFIEARRRDLLNSRSGHSPITYSAYLLKGSTPVLCPVNTSLGTVAALEKWRITMLGAYADNVGVELRVRLAETADTGLSLAADTLTEMVSFNLSYEATIAGQAQANEIFKDAATLGFSIAKPEVGILINVAQANSSNAREQINMIPQQMMDALPGEVSKVLLLVDDTIQHVRTLSNPSTSIAAPSLLSAIAVSSSQINLTWRDNSNNETGFRLQRRKTGGEFADIPTAAAANSQAFANTAGLTAGTTYFYRIRAFDSTGNSEWSAEASATTFAPAGSAHTLTIASANPSSGVNVSSYVGNGSFAFGVTPTSRSFANGATVGVTCPAAIGGLVFQRWQLEDGSDFDFSTVTTITMNGPHTLTAVYGAAPLPPKVLSSLTIEGALSVDERSSEQYRARANYTDGSSAYMDANAAWEENSSYTTISAAGLLDTDAVTSNREIEIKATLTAGGVTKSDTKNVTIRNTDETAAYTLSLNTTIGGAIGFSPKGSSYADGTVVSLHANRDDGFVFSHWSGDVASSATDDDITVLMDRNRSITAHFVVDATVGNIRVDISPSQAVTEGAGWKYDNFTAWRPSGDMLDGLSPRVGRYVNFKDISGWITPNAIKADIRGGETTIISGAAATYRELPGVVQVTFSPEEAGTAGGRWRLDNGPWLTSGASVVDVVPGNHQVEFQAASGWTPPQNRQITVQRAGTSIVLGEYQPPLGKPLITGVFPKTGPIAGGTLLSIDGANFTADATVSIGGRPASNVTFVGTTRLTAVTPASPTFGSADIVVTVGTGGAANANAFAYGIPRGTNMTLVTASGGLYQAIACNNQHLFVGQGTTFQVYDISHPTSPSLVSSIAIPGIIRAVALNGNYAVVAADDAGVHILDISNPTTPRLRGFYNTSGTAFGVKVLAGRAYVADLSRGLVILDVTNPDAPMLISSLALGIAAFDVALRNSTKGLFALLSASGRLLIVDISNPQLPSMHAEAVVEGSGNNYSLALAGNLAFLGRQANGIDIVDISNLENPVLQGRILENNIYATVCAAGDIVVLAGRGPSGFKVMNVSGVTATERGRLDSSEFAMDTSDSYRCAIHNGIAWIAGGTAIYGVNITNADAPQRIFSKDELAGRFEKLTATGSSIAASSLNHLFGFDYSGDAVTPVAALTREGQSRALVVASGVLLDFRGVYHADVNGTRVLRTSMEVGSLFQSMNASVLPQMHSKDGYRIGNRVLNLSRAHSDDHPIICELDPTRTDAGWIVRQHDLPKVQGSFAENIVGSQDFFIISFENSIGNSLQRHGWGASTADWEISGLKFVNVLRLSHANRFLHVGMQQEYRLYDLINPVNPVCLSTNSITSTVRDILIDGDDVYLAAHGQGVLVLDMSNRTELALKRSYDTPGGAFAIAKIGDRLIVADYGAGIQVLGLPDITPPQVFIAAPVALQEFQTSSSSISLGGGAVDDSGQVIRVAWSNDRGGGGLAEGTADWLVAPVILHLGMNVLTVTAYDAEGNSSTDQITVISTQPDTTAPAIAITGPKPDVEFAVGTAIITLSGSAADNQSVASVTWSNGAGGSGPATLTGQTWTVANVPLGTGPNVIQVTATDAAGNSASDSAVVFLVPPDTTPPFVTIDFPTANAVLETSIGELNLSGLASDDQGVVRVEWSDGRGGQGVAAGAFPWSVNGIALQPGLNVIEVRAFDDAGNAAADTLAVTYVPPPLELEVLGVVDGVFRFQVFGPVGSNVAIQRSADFGQWEPLGTRTIPLEGTTTVEDTSPLGGQSFYRVVPQGQ